MYSFKYPKVKKWTEKKQQNDLTMKVWKKELKTNVGYGSHTNAIVRPKAVLALGLKLEVFQWITLKVTKLHHNMKILKLLINDLLRKMAKMSS